MAKCQVNSERKIFTKIVLMIFAVMFFVAVSGQVVAKENNSVPELVNVGVVAEKIEIQPDALNSSKSNINNGLTANYTASNSVALLTIFADPTSNGSNSSGGSTSSAFGTHAFITVKNVSNSTINIGKFSGIGTGKTMSLGAWGNKSEHTGLWYNLEEYFIYNSSSAYSGRVSISFYITASQLNALNSYIINNDKWTATNNCSSFAVNAWNVAVDSSYKLSAGIPNTPKNLATNIKKFSYSIKASVPYNYVVYYARGTGTPIKSTIYK